METVVPLDTFCAPINSACSCHPGFQILQSVPQQKKMVASLTTLLPHETNYALSNSTKQWLIKYEADQHLPCGSGSQKLLIMRIY